MKEEIIFSTIKKRKKKKLQENSWSLLKKELSLSWKQSKWNLLVYISHFVQSFKQFPLNLKGIFNWKFIYCWFEECECSECRDRIKNLKFFKHNKKERVLAFQLQCHRFLYFRTSNLQIRRKRATLKSGWKMLNIRKNKSVRKTYSCVWN